MSDMNTNDPFNNLEHNIVRVLIILLLVISCIKLLVFEVSSLTH
jgi:hypothetical protein